MSGPQRLPNRLSVEEYRSLATGRRIAPKSFNRPKRRLVSAAPQESALPLRFRLPFLPPSVNKLFATIRDTDTGALRRVLTTQARRIRKLICAMVRGKLAPSALYELQVNVYMNAYTRSGELRQVDVSNRIKFLEDCLCHALGIDDRQFFRVTLTKIHSDTEQTEIAITRFAADERERDAA